MIFDPIDRAKARAVGFTQMRRYALFLIGLGLVLSASGRVRAQDPADPVPVDKIERAEVRLVLLNTIVVDSDGLPVAGLQGEDFEIRSGGGALTPAVFEAHCEPPEPALQSTAVVRERLPRRIVLLFDYLHLPMMQREWSLDTAMKMVREGVTEGDEVLIAALTGGLRIEQPFSSDPKEILDSLKRMQKDVSLWNGNFSHDSEIGFVRGMTSLFDVLASASTGPKAVVMYSAMQDVPLDLEFEKIASLAAASRSSLYTVDPYGLRPSELRGGEVPWLPG